MSDTRKKKAAKRAKKKPKGARQPTPHEPAPRYQLRVTLADTAPPVWRRIQVPGDITLSQLHGVLQVVMGWEDYHLYLFEAGGKQYGAPDAEWDIDIGRADRATLRQVAPGAGATFRYTYDFGDDWEHEIVVEDILPAAAGPGRPLCLAGGRACPPEDCGGPWGYAELLEKLRDLAHPERDELLEWLGGDFDPEEFDAAAVDLYLEAHYGRGPADARHFLDPRARIFDKLCEIARSAPQGPSAGSWRVMVRRMESRGATDYQLVTAARSMRDAGVLGPDAAMFLVDWAAEQIALERSDRDPTLKRLSRQLDDLERSHGLAPDEYWTIAEAPAEHNALSDAWADAFDALWDRTLVELGEPEIVELRRRDRTEYERRAEEGRRYFHGPLPEAGQGP